MEPGEYLTNVLSFNNFASIHYEYFESQNLSSGVARKHLQRLEAAWRQEGRLVHCDPYREGIWAFQSYPNTSGGSPIKDVDPSNLNVVEIQGLGLLKRDKGTYEPANLARTKQTVSNTISTPSSSSSPSSSLESTLRNAQALNTRSIQTNSALNVTQEPPTPSPGLKSDAAPSLKDIHEYFISSVLGSIVYFLCRDHGFIPLNSRTLILTPQKSAHLGSVPNRGLIFGNTIELATLDISLTSLGTLVIKAHADMASGLQPLMSLSGSANLLGSLLPGTALWLAPSGSAAKFHSVPEDRKVPGSFSTSQVQASPPDHRPNGFTSLTLKSWQTKCLEWLSAKGLDSAALEAGGWLFVQIFGGPSPYSNADFRGIPMLDDLAIVPWPALLCFQTSTPGTRDMQHLTSVSSTRDPLSFAEEWFTSKDERAFIVSKRQKERLAAEALSREQADVESRAIQSNTYSPAALRRSSNAGAMYPTPPDAPHHHIGATPSFDGNVSTPGNPSHFIPHDTGTVLPSNQGVADVDTDMWDSSGKKERTNSGMHFNDNDNDNDNLFGDLGGDIFGTHITDDDFNFFDEPDAVQFDPKPASPGLALPPAMEDTSCMAVTPTPNPTTVDVFEASNTDLLNRDPGNSTEYQQDPSSFITGDLEDKTDKSPPKDIDANVQTDLHSLPPIRLPFNKEIIFKRLVQDSTELRVQKQPRRASLFNKIDFEDALLSVNEKYAAHGQFNFSRQRATQQHVGLSGLPRTGYLSSRRKPQDDVQVIGNLAHILVDKDSMHHQNVSEPMDYLLESDCASPISEQDDSSHTTDEQSVPYKLGVKRKWENEDRNEITSSFDALAMEFEHNAATPQSATGSQLPLLDADPADWALTTYFASPEPDVQSTTLSDLERIATAQILADQAVSGTLRLPGATSSEAPCSSDKVSATRQLMHRLVKATKFSSKDTNTCTMRSFLEIQGIPVLTQALRLPPRPIPNPRGPNSLDITKPNNLFPIPPPQIEVRRSDSRLSILPASVTFWENLGLGPSKGAKDVNAVCIYPNFEGVAANASIFLDQMRSVFESSRFGSHDRVVSKDISNGLLAFTVDPLPQNKVHQLTTLKETTARLSRTLSSLPVEEKNFVVYFVYPVDNNALLVHICSAFQHLFNIYRKALSERRMNTANELVLQLIPLNFIASPTSLAVPLPSKYFQLAMEVYDRCIDFASSSSSPAIMLEQPLPKNIDFKLNPNPSASLLQENTCLHVAYAQSIDDRWITAAWTDNRGTRQMTASYCLGRKNEPISTSFSDIAHEIWETTLDFISSKKIHWRIMIARVGVMDSSELDFWTALASTESDALINLTLITVQTDPSLRLLPATVTLAPNSTAAHSVITPVSTPQALQSSIVSPENATTPVRETPTSATPVEAPVEPDSDARLVDYTDQSWGAILSHRLNNSNSLLEINLALISGYIIKRGGTNSDDPPIVMEVNIVHSEVVGNPRTFHESLLREVLGYYRGLGTLARVRGVVDEVRDVRPWHVAAAEKAVKSLYMLM